MACPDWAPGWACTSVKFTGAYWAWKGGSGAASTAAGNAVTEAWLKFSIWVAEGATTAIMYLVREWADFNTIPVTDQSGALPEIRNSTAWLVGFIAVASILVVGVRMVLERDGRSAGHLGRSLAILVLVSAGGTLVVQTLVEASDAYSAWIVTQAADKEFEADLTRMFATILTSGGSGFMLVMAFLTLVSAVVQAILLLLRGAALVLLTGLLPLAAAAGLTESGARIRSKYFKWLLAFLLFKPAAATIYAFAFWLISKSPDDKSQLAGLCLFVVAICALPALLRLLNPDIVDAPFGNIRGPFTDWNSFRDSFLKRYW